MSGDLESVDIAPVSGVRPASPRVLAGAWTHPGRRAHNADAFVVDVEAGFYAVTDGIGDSARSSVVAQAAIDAVRELFADAWAGARGPRRSADDAERRLALGISQAHGRLYAPHLPRPLRNGSTFAGVVDCGLLLCVGHVGDSRVYVLDAAQERLVSLTVDHTVAGYARRRGVAADVAATLPRACHLTQAVGLRVEAPEVSVFTWHAGDTLLICTDGVSDAIEDDAIRAILLDTRDVEGAARRLVETAIQRGGKDNATAIVLHRMS